MRFARGLANHHWKRTAQYLPHDEPRGAHGLSSTCSTWHRGPDNERAKLESNPWLLSGTHLCAKEMGEIACLALTRWPVMVSFNGVDVGNSLSGGCEGVKVSAGGLANTVGVCMLMPKIRRRTTARALL